MLWVFKPYFKWMLPDLRLFGSKSLLSWLVESVVPEVGRISLNLIYLIVVVLYLIIVVGSVELGLRTKIWKFWVFSGALHVQWGGPARAELVRRLGILLQQVCTCGHEFCIWRVGSAYAAREVHTSEYRAVFSGVVPHMWLVFQHEWPGWDNFCWGDMAGSPHVFLHFLVLKHEISSEIHNFFHSLSL